MGLQRASGPPNGLFNHFFFIDSAGMNSRRDDVGGVVGPPTSAPLDNSVMTSALPRVGRADSLDTGAADLIQKKDAGLVK